MSVGEALRELGEFLDECESSGHVRSVELTGDAGSNSGDSLTAKIAVELSMDQMEGEKTGLSLGEATVNGAGETRFVLESPTPILPATDHEVDLDVMDASIDADGSVSATLSASLADREGSPTETGSSTTAASVGPGDATRTREVPPFRDPELLEEVYSSCDTFEEMTDAIGMDVTAETVRRYMIDHDIHQPESYDTDDAGGSDVDPSGTKTGGDTPTSGSSSTGGRTESDGETAGDGDAQHVVLTDGIGLPDDVTVETLIETVKRSNTVLEVKRDLGIERQEALEMLQRLDMVDLVIGRLDAETERHITREDVIERLRAVSATA